MSHILDYLKIYNYQNKIRLGVNCDGGYVIGDIGGYDFYISAGVSTEESFTRDFIEKYKMNKYNCAAFDGTIERYPYNYTKNIIFYKRNIGPNTTKETANLSFFTSNYNDIFLKMDIEGSEYGWVKSLTIEQLKKFKQITIEFHSINDDGLNINLNDKIECFKKLADTHYPIHIHGNNYAGKTNNIPDVVEVTYLRKDCFNEEPELNKTSLPIPNLDFRNHGDYQDHNLNFPPFTN
jgi:hypothetical protein